MTDNFEHIHEFIDYLNDVYETLGSETATAEQLTEVHQRLLDYRDQFTKEKAQWAGGDPEVFQMYEELVRLFPMALETNELRLAIIEKRSVRPEYLRLH